MEMVLEVVRDGEGMQQLEGDLIQMVGNPVYSDVVLVCGDGSRVHACRPLLMARSAFFRSMFSNGMAESRQAEVALPSIPSSSVLLPALEYLYTGAISKQSIDFDMALQLLHSVRFLLMPKLEGHIVTHILEPAILNTADPSILAQHLSRIVDSAISDCHHLCKALQHIVRSLRKMDVACDSVSRCHLRHLSWAAMQVYLDKSKTRNDVPSLSIMEYMRLRDILLWAAFHLSPEDEEALLSYLPHEACLLHLLDPAYKSSQPLSHLLPLEDHKETLTKLKAFIAGCPIDWSQAVNLPSIHPAILLHIVKPLNVIEPSTLLEESLNYHALHMVEMKMMMWVPTRDQLKSYQTLENGSLLVATQSAEKELWFVKANRAINKTSGLYEFKVFVEEVASELAIGVASLPFNNWEHGAFLGMGKGHLWYYDKDIGEKRRSRSAGMCIQGRSCVTVQVDMSKSSCTFFVNGRKVKDVQYDGLPEELYPFVYTQPPGKLRIILVNNADSM